MIITSWQSLNGNLFTKYVSGDGRPLPLLHRTATGGYAEDSSSLLLSTFALSQRSCYNYYCTCRRWVMNKRLRARINISLATTAMLFSIFLQGCGPAGSTPGPPVILVSISVTPANSSIAPGTTAQLTATGTFSNGSIQNITTTATWNSTNTSVATISNAVGSPGLATALASIGTTTITAVSSSIIGTTTLSAQHVSSIAVTPSTPASIAPGTTQQFTATGALAGGSMTQNLTPFATWTALNTGSGTVSDAAGSKGLATAGSTSGQATIQAGFDGVTGSATLTSSPVQAIAVAPITVNVLQGFTQQFTATGTLMDSNTQSLTTWATWNSSSTSVSTISNATGSNGLATALAVGTTNIAAVFDNVTSSPVAVLTVTQPVLQSIAITPITQSISLGLTQQYRAIASYSDGSMPDITSLVTWNASQPSVATISNISSSKGLAISVGQGTTAITASLSGITSNSATLTITPAALVSITVSPASAAISLAAGKTTQQFTATGTFTNGSLQDLTASVTWVSSNTSVATISNITGTKGLATISLVSPLPDSTNITASFSGITSDTAILTVTF